MTPTYKSRDGRCSIPMLGVQPPNSCKLLLTFERKPDFLSGFFLLRNKGLMWYFTMTFSRKSCSESQKMHIPINISYILYKHASIFSGSFCLGTLKKSQNPQLEDIRLARHHHLPMRIFFWCVPWHENPCEITWAPENRSGNRH